MIEIPKYSVPTYDPKSTAVNQRTDFTRRIPTGLSEKQMGRDAKIMMQIVRAEGHPEEIIDIFTRKAHLLSNPRYWEVMRTVWVAVGSTETAPLFRTLMQSGRPCRSWFMTPEDAAALEAMPFPLTVWRAYDAEPDPGISWTLDEQWCRGYAKAKGRRVKQMQVSRDQVFAYVSRRGEEEVIIL